MNGDEYSDVVVGAQGHADETGKAYLYLSQTGRIAQDIVAGRGLGAISPNQVRVFTERGLPTGVDFLPFSAGQWGVTVATGEVDGGTTGEMLAGPGPGPALGPQVRGFSASGAALGKLNFYAYGTLRFGVNVNAGEFDGDAFDEVLTGAGPGEVFGPHVRGWNFDGLPLAAISRVNYFAYSTLRFGVNAASGDVDGDDAKELLTGPGPGPTFGPQVRGWNYDGGPLSAITGFDFLAFATPQYGVNLAGSDVDDDGADDVIATPGPGALLSSRFRGFAFDGASTTALPGYDVTPFATRYGGRVGLGDIDADATAELLAGAGRDPAADSTIAAYSYSSQILTVVGISLEAFSGGSFGVNPAAGSLGF